MGFKLYRDTNKKAAFYSVRKKKGGGAGNLT